MADQKRFGPKGCTPDRIPPLEGKTYLITGATAGAGFEAARLLLARGASVVALNRNAEKSRSAILQLKQEFGDDADVRFVLLDLAVLDSVRQAAAEVLETVPRIDALICNAAIAQVARRELTVDGFESQLGVNHYGHFLLCGLLFERIDASRGRIVVVASEGHKLGLRTIKFDDMNWDSDYNPNHAYSQSKLAQMMFAYGLQDRVAAAHRNVEVLVCHPGASKTSLINENAGFATRISWSLMTMTPLVQSAEKGAYPEVMCATEAGLTQRAYYGPTGFINFGGPVDQGELGAFAHEKDTVDRLWEESEKATSFT